jgi:hypothetical protein
MIAAAVSPHLFASSRDLLSHLFLYTTLIVRTATTQASQHLRLLSVIYITTHFSIIFWDWEIIFVSYLIITFDTHLSFIGLNIEPLRAG